MTAVESAIAEIHERLATFAPRHQGLVDYYRLQLNPDTSADDALFIAIYDRRIDLLNRALTACQALMADGHPDLPLYQVSPSELADLKAHAAAIEAALTQFESNAATSMAFTAGPIEPKP